MKKKPLIISIVVSIIIVFALILVFSYVNRNKDKTSKDVSTIKKELLERPKFDFSLYVDIAIEEKGQFYSFTFTTKSEDINDLKILITSKENKDLSLTYGFYNANDSVLVVEATDSSQIEAVKLATSSSKALNTFYIYLSYNVSEEYISLGLGD